MRELGAFMDNLSKIKHSKRIHQKENHVKKQIKIAKCHGFLVDEPHKLAKHHAMNCGDPKCHTCGNPRKFYNEKTITEKSFEQTEKWTE